MSAREISSQTDFRERARTNDIPIARLIGFEAKDIAEGRATVVLAAGPQHANPMGTLHGGILCDIADAAMGIAFASTLARLQQRKLRPRGPPKYPQVIQDHPNCGLGWGLRCCRLILKCLLLQNKLPIYI